MEGNIKVFFKKHTLTFKFDAGTSRGVLKTKDTYYVCISENDLLVGLGEAAPLFGLSIDEPSLLEATLESACRKLQQMLNASQGEVYSNDLISKDFPALRFGFEMALKDYYNDGKRVYYDNTFVKGTQSIPINGLIWMSNKANMLRQITQKIEAGYKCIKLKIGAINFEEECELLKYIRKQLGPDDITVRVDANGSFTPKGALDKLKKLSEYQLHSIEQPISAGNYESMKSLCEESPLPIALDEELIGLYGDDKHSMLKEIRPQYVILKPTLLGGFKATDEWIKLAEAMHIGWWLTSALESNVGLSAIAQYTAELPYKSFQGLGTGQLFHNNITSPLAIEDGNLFYKLNLDWDLSIITN